MLQPVEFPRPFDAIAGRQADVPGNALLRLGDGTGKIAAANAEFNRNEALIAVTKDIGCPRVQRDGGQFAQGNIGIAARRRLSADLEVLDTVDVVPEFGRQTNGDVELPIGLEQGC